MSLIKFKRGLKTNLPTLAVGEPGFTTDTKEFFIGTDTGNIQLGNMMKSVYDSNNDGIVDNSEALNGQAGSYYLSRTNHTGTQLSTTISDFTEAAQDVVGAMVVDGTTIDFTYDDVANTLTAEVIDASITAAKLAANSVTTAKIADGNVTFAKLDPNAVQTTAEGLVANDTSLPTSGLVKSVTDSLDSRITDIETGTLNTEAVQDIVGSTFVDSSTIDFTYDDVANTMTGGIIDGSVGTSKLADDSVTAAKVAADVAGNGLVQNGTSGALDVNVDDSTLAVSADTLQVKDAGIVTVKIADANVTTAKLADDSVTAAKVAADVAGSALVQNGTTGALDVSVDGATIEVNADALRIKDAGVTAAKLASDSVTTVKIVDANVTSAKLADDAVTAAKVAADVAGNGLVQNISGALDVNVDDSTIEVATDTLQVKDAGITTTKIADANVTTAKIADANVTTAKIADGNVTFAKVSSSDIETDLSVSASASKFVTAQAAKDYADAVATGLAVHEPVRAATTANLTATYDNGTSGVGATLTNSGTQAALSLDGVSLSVNDRVLVKNQTTVAHNGIYVVTTVGDGSTNWVLTRAGDFDNSPVNEIHDGDFFFVGEGTLYGDTGFVQTNVDPVTIGTDAIEFAQFSGAGQITAGDGLSKTGNELDVNVDGSTIEIVSDSLRVKDAGIVTAKIADANVTTGKLADDSVTAAKVAADVAGTGLVQNVSGALDVNVDDSTLAITADVVHVKDAGIVTAKIADSNVTTAKIADANVTTAKLADDSVTAAKLNEDVAGSALVQNGTTGALDVNVDGSTIEVNADTLRIKDAGVTTAKIADANVTTGKLADDSVTAAKLGSDVAGVAMSQNGTSGALDVNYDNSSIKVNGSDQLYVDLVDGGSF